MHVKAQWFLSSGVVHLFAPSFFWRDLVLWFHVSPLELRTWPQYDPQQVITRIWNYRRWVQIPDGLAIDVPGVKATDMKVKIEQNGSVLHLRGGRKIVKKMRRGNKIWLAFLDRWLHWPHKAYGKPYERGACCDVREETTNGGEDNQKCNHRGA